jgi:crotonobetainyl-CoA:carnitine CoA-transferase CaiB-like acyl-CoA transferase
LRGVVRGRHGRGHARLYPYDLYPAKDGWVVVAAPTADSWTKLAKLIGVSDRSFDDPVRRRAARADVDRRIEAYTSVRSATELEALGRASDVAISRIYDISAIAQDPHYRARNMLVEWDDPVAGRVKGAGIAPKFESTPGGVWRGAPWLGQDNEAVLGGLLGYPVPRIDSLRRSGVLGAFRPVAPHSEPRTSESREQEP